jgi:hypothetical protein
MFTYVFNPTSVSVAKSSPQQAPNGATVPQTWVHTAACLHTCLQRPHDFRVLSRLHIIFTFGSLWHVLAPTQLAPGLWPRPNLSHAGLTCHAPPGSWGTKWAYAVFPPQRHGEDPTPARNALKGEFLGGVGSPPSLAILALWPLIRASHVGGPGLTCHGPSFTTKQSHLCWDRSPALLYTIYSEQQSASVTIKSRVLTLHARMWSRLLGQILVWCGTRFVIMNKHRPHHGILQAHRLGATTLITTTGKTMTRTSTLI